MDSKKKIFLEDADRPPPSYYKETLQDLPLRRAPFQTPKPDEWLKAPEFVPRSRLEEAFECPVPESGKGYGGDENSRDVPYVPMHHDAHIYGNALHQFAPFTPYPMAPPLMSSPHHHLVGPGVGHHGATGLPPPNMPFIPNGYTANITHLNSGHGPPIPAIVLRKKRRKRNRHTNSMALNSSESPCSSHPLDPTGEGSGTETPEETPLQDGRNILSGSCPDLSEEQRQLWDDYLFDAAVGSSATKAEEDKAMKTSFYEIAPRCLFDVADEVVNGISNPEIRRLDREINGNAMTSSMVLRRFGERNPKADADGSTERSLQKEMEQLSFRPELSKYGYPQIDAASSLMASFHHDNVHSTIVNKNILCDSDEDPYEEDCFEGMNITVNAFDACDDLSLSDIEGQASRFEQIHQALKRNSQRYAADLRPPDRVCCVIM